jgi:hypothetical protein
VAIAAALVSFHFDHLILVRKKFPSPQATRMDVGRIWGAAAEHPANDGTDPAA